MEDITPDYKRIYKDILEKKYPDKKQLCKNLLDKKKLTSLDIIELNKKIFGIVDQSSEMFNRRHRCYTQSDILKILDYQKKNNINNSQLAKHFKLSRNTIAKWKNFFQYSI